MRAPPESISPTNGGAVADRQIHHPADLVAGHFAQAAAADGEILRIRIDGPAVDQAESGDHTVGIAPVIATRQVCPLGDKRFGFLEGPGVEQQFQPFTGSQLALGVLLGDTILTAGKLQFGAFFTQFENSGIFFRHFHSSIDLRW